MRGSYVRDRWIWHLLTHELRCFSAAWYHTKYCIWGPLPPHDIITADLAHALLNIFKVEYYRKWVYHWAYAASVSPPALGVGARSKFRVGGTLMMTSSVRFVNILVFKVDFFGLFVFCLRCWNRVSSQSWSGSILGMQKRRFFGGFFLGPTIHTSFLAEWLVDPSKASVPLSPPSALPCPQCGFLENGFSVSNQPISIQRREMIYQSLS